MPIKEQRMLLSRPGDSDGPFVVVVMAVVKKYAMVRRPGCVPFVAEVRHLSEVAS